MEAGSLGGTAPGIPPPVPGADLPTGDTKMRVTGTKVIVEEYKSGDRQWAAATFWREHGILPEKVGDDDVAGECMGCKAVLFDGDSFETDDKGIICSKCSEGVLPQTPPKPAAAPAPAAPAERKPKKGLKELPPVVPEEQVEKDMVNILLDLSPEQGTAKLFSELVHEEEE